MCDKLEKMGKHGNMAETCTQDVRKVGAEPKSNNGSGAERPRWADYEDFEVDVDDIGDGFKDETDANLVITWSRNPHAKTQIPGKPSKSSLIEV